MKTSVNSLLKKADILAAASNRCVLVGAYVQATMYHKKALELRKKASKIGDKMESDQRKYNQDKGKALWI